MVSPIFLILCVEGGTPQTDSLCFSASTTYLKQLAYVGLFQIDTC